MVSLAVKLGGSWATASETNAEKHKRTTTRGILLFKAGPPTEKQKRPKSYSTWAVYYAICRGLSLATILAGRGKLGQGKGLTLWQHTSVSLATWKAKSCHWLLSRNPNCAQKKSARLNASPSAIY